MLNETATQLVKHLEHPNGWWRDTAQKILVIRANTSVVPALEKIAIKGRSIEARLHALWTLEGIDALSKELVLNTLKDPEERLRATTLRLLESFYSDNKEEVKKLLITALDDPSSDVSLQALLSLNYLKIEELETILEKQKKQKRSAGFIKAFKLIEYKMNASRTSRKYSTAEIKKLKAGEDIYHNLCAACHGADGKGMKSGKMLLAPPLAGSPRVRGPQAITNNIILKGLMGPIEGHSYPGVMMSMAAHSDRWISYISSYIRTNFGNMASLVTAEEVATVRAQVSNRKTPWTMKELQANHFSALQNKNIWSLKSKGKDAKHAIDDELNTFFTTKRDYRKSDYFEIDFKETKQIGGISLDVFENIKTMPAEVTIATSTDGENWNDVTKATTANYKLIDIMFDQIVPARFLKISPSKVSPDKAPWNINNIEIYVK